MATPACPGLVVMLKAPANAKRRLAAQIGDLAEAAATHLLACALEDALAWPGPIWLSPAGPRDRDWLLSEIGAAPIQKPASSRQWTTCDDLNNSGNRRHTSQCQASHGRTGHGRTGHGRLMHFDSALQTAIRGTVLQQGGNLGERINHVDSRVRGCGRGADRLLYLGADCPGLDAAYLRRAAKELEKADAVLGPAGDGGVVLMGARRPWPDLGGLSWSTGNLYTDLRGICLDAGWRVATLDAREDVDTLRDLLDVETALSSDGRSSRRDFAAWLREHRYALSLLKSNVATDTGREAAAYGIPSDDDTGREAAACDIAPSGISITAVTDRKATKRDAPSSAATHREAVA